MQFFVVLIALLSPTAEVVTQPAEGDAFEPMRYRGIEQLLAKFEAEAVEE